MTDPAPTPTAWRCVVCGYIHYGPEPPEECTVCGAPRSDFEPYAEAVPATPSAPPVRQWRCMICDYVHDGATPPEECPVCGAAADCFEAVAPAPAAPAKPTGRAPRVVVIGAGVAGVAAVEALRAAAPDAEITLVGRELGLPYYRINLTRYLAGEIGLADLPLHPESWYSEQSIELLAGAEATTLDLTGHAVELEGGHRLGYDKLILTAGAHPFLPPIPGADRENVTALRTLEEAEAILAAAGAGRRVVIIGGGILGLEAAGGLARRGAEVTVLEGFGWLLPRQLNQRAGELLATHVSRLGITLRPLAATREIAGTDRASGVALENGEILPADIVVLSTGIRANTHLARQAGLAVGQGIVVDDHLVTSHPDVLAAGDAAEHRGVVYGLWGPAQYQGKIAGMNAGGGRHEFGGLPRSATLKVLGIELFSSGAIAPEDAATEVLEEEVEERYYRFLVRDGRLCGAILLGDTRAAGAVKRAIESHADLSALLRQRPGAAELAAAMHAS